MAKKIVATRLERVHMSKVASLGGLVCQRPANVHHIRPVGLGMGMRSSHYKTIPLCRDHHQGQFSIHNCKQEFEAMYGTEHEMLRKTLKEIKNIEEANNFFNYNNGENNDRNESHFEIIDANKQRLYEKQKKTINIIKTLLNDYTKKQLIELIEKESKNG